MRADGGQIRLQGTGGKDFLEHLGRWQDAAVRLVEQEDPE